jgi:basic membrane protein A
MNRSEHLYPERDRIPAQRRRPTRTRSAGAAGLVAVALFAAACNPFSGSPSATVSPTAAPSRTSVAATRTPTPTPTPQLVKTITLVAAVAEPKGATPGGMAWQGIQDAGTKVQATTALVEPASNADLPSEVDAAATGDRAIVVTIGPSAHAAVLAAASAHPATQFFEFDVAIPTGAPDNVHGIVFDAAEAGYMAGFVAASFAGDGKVAFVGPIAADVSAAGYAAGFRNGATQGRSGISVLVGDDATPDAPDKGRTATAALVKSGATVISAAPDLSGIGALREACTRKASLVAVAADAWQTVPDVQSCLIVSVVNRYDIAVGNAIAGIAAGRSAPATIVEDVSTGGLTLSDFHAARPAGFDADLAAVLGALQAGPPLPTAAPPDAASAQPGGSKAP